MARYGHKRRMPDRTVPAPCTLLGYAPVRTRARKADHSRAGDLQVVCGGVLRVRSFKDLDQGPLASDRPEWHVFLSCLSFVRSPTDTLDLEPLAFESCQMSS